MQYDTFRRRIQYLEKEKFPVLRLDQALSQLFGGKLPPAATVLTFDDGWAAIKLYAHNILNEKSYHYTIYLTSYYSLKETPIFPVVVRYMFWRTRKDRVDLKGLGVPAIGGVSLSDANKLTEVIERIITYGESKLDNVERCTLARRLGEHLGVSYTDIEKTRLLSLLTASEISELIAADVDIQLHTHRHRWPLGERPAIKELTDNKSFLEPLVGKRLVHFCYPSGRWKREHITYLDSAKIKSATTCEPGFNYPWTPMLALRRLVDSERISQIEFEAKMVGYWELLRKLLELVKTRLSAVPAATKRLWV